MDRHRRDESDDTDDVFDDADLTEGVYMEQARPLVACPYCREAVFEEARYCPRCENDISTESRDESDTEDRGGNDKPIWVWVCLILALLAAFSMAVN